MQILLLSGTDSTGFLGQFLLHFGVVWAAFRVQFRLLPSTVFAAVLGQLLGAIQVRILVRFGCTFGYFLVRFLAVVLGQLLAAIRVQFCCAFLVHFWLLSRGGGQFSAAFWCSFCCISGTVSNAFRY